MSWVVAGTAVAGAVAGWFAGSRVRAGRYSRPGEDPRRALHPAWAALATGMLWALAPAGDNWAGFLWGLSTWCAVLVTVVDLHVHRIPDAVTAPWSAVTVGWLLAAVLVGPLGWGEAAWALGLAGATGVLMVVLAVLTRGGVGLGDVKLSALIALTVGWAGWQLVGLSQTVAWIVGGLWTAMMLLGGRTSKRQNVPMGPFLALGLVVALQLALHS